MRLLKRSSTVIAHVPPVKRALAGEHSTFETLVNRYRTMLASYIGGFFKDREQMLDVLQPVFLQLYFSLPVLLTAVSLNGWLFEVARNRCLDELRRKRKLPSISSSILER